jgi:Methyltransferase domain
LVTVDALHPRHIVIDPFQQQAFNNVGSDLLRSAGLDSITTLVATPSSIALAQLVTERVVADAAFIDGSHRFHEVFVDLYFLRKIVKPGGLIILDDHHQPPVRAAVRYYERNLGWAPIPDAFTTGTFKNLGGNDKADVVPRCRAVRLPTPSFEPPFEDSNPSDSTSGRRDFAGQAVTPAATTSPPADHSDQTSKAKSSHLWPLGLSY